MSLLRTKGLQIGQDGTATNNFTLYQPGVPDGTLRIGNGNNGSVTDAITLSSSGNVGIGTSNPVTKLQVVGQLAVDGGDASIQTRGSTPWLMVSSNEGYGTSGMHLKLDNTSGAQAIFFDNTTARMIIDSSGRVTMPYQPYFFAQRSTTWTGWVPSNQTQPMLFDNVITNLGNHFNGSTGLFTAPVAGVYQFWSGIYSPGYTQTQHWPVINGVRGTTYALYPAGANNITGTFFIKLNANDTVGFHAFDGASSGQVTATAEHTFFYGHLIG